MKETRLLMGMPITVKIVGKDVQEKIFSHFEQVDRTFSTYKPESEVSRLNRGELRESEWSNDVKTVLELCEETKKETNGYFDIGKKNGTIDPSGMVKGWAIQQAAELLRKEGIKNFYIEAGGDIMVSGKNEKGDVWRIGIKNPFDQTKIVKVLQVTNVGVATSGTYIRGEHVYDPVGQKKLDEIVSLTVIGPNIYEADRFATAAFAMGKKGIEFIEKLQGFEGYQIDKNGQATYTSAFGKFVVN